MRVRKISLSTGQTLSILTTAVVVAVLAIGVSVTWPPLRRSAVDAAQDRMTRGVRQLATNAATTLPLRQPRYAAVTADPAMRRALSSRSSGQDAVAARAALTTLQEPTDSGLPIELWRGQDRRRVAFI